MSSALSSSARSASLLAPIPGAGVTPQLTIETIPRDWQALIISFLDWPSHFTLARVNKNLHAACAVRESWCSASDDAHRVIELSVPTITSLTQLVGVRDGVMRSALSSAAVKFASVPLALQLCPHNYYNDDSDDADCDLDENGIHVNDVNDEWLRVVSSLTSLRRLDLSRCDVITDTGIAHLCTLTQLRHLNLSECRSVSDAGFEHVSSLKLLQTLSVASAQVTDVGLVHVSSLTQLRELDLSRTNVTDDGLVHLRSLTQLQTLKLNLIEELTGAGFVHLSTLAQLRTLECRDTGITDATLTRVSTLPMLSTLDVQGCDVTDDGIMAALPQLRVVKRD